MRLGLLGIAVLLAVSGCAGHSSLSAEEFAHKMALPDATVLKVTGENDPNHMLGRSSGYTSKVAISVPGKRCATVAQECGVEIEVFKSTGAAKARAAYIEAITQSASVLGSEYDTVRGTALLRVQGDLPPAVARRYQAAFKTVAAG